MPQPCPRRTTRSLADAAKLVGPTLAVARRSAADGAELWRRLTARGFRGALRVISEWATRRRRAEKPNARQLQIGQKDRAPHDNPWRPAAKAETVTSRRDRSWRTVLG